jgi:hypothetical protein
MSEDHPHIFSIKDALEEQMYGKRVLPNEGEPPN